MQNSKNQSCTNLKNTTCEQQLRKQPKCRNDRQKEESINTYRLHNHTNKQ